MRNANLPSIWIGDFRSKTEFDANSAHLASVFSIYDWIDDRMLHSRHPMVIPAYCSVCRQVTRMHIDWTFAAEESATHSIHPAWTETGICSECGLNSRIRALFDFITIKYDTKLLKKVYIPEQVTPFYQRLKKLIPSLIGSEYLGDDHSSGRTYKSNLFQKSIRHEDLRNLSFSDNEFELVLTLDVFEHIPVYQEAFQEVYRVLLSNGSLIFTIPFFFNIDKTMIRASIVDGKIVHHLPPEIHGNPVSSEGALCFQNFGWDILQNLREAGFKDAAAHLYWGPWQSHLGYPFFVFHAVK